MLGDVVLITYNLWPERTTRVAPGCHRGNLTVLRCRRSETNTLPAGAISQRLLLVVSLLQW